MFDNRRPLHNRSGFQVITIIDRGHDRLWVLIEYNITFIKRFRGGAIEFMQGKLGLWGIAGRSNGEPVNFYRGVQAGIIMLPAMLFDVIFSPTSIDMARH